MTLLLNLIWLVFGGLVLAAGYVVAGVIACLLVVTLPFGLAAFRLAGYVLWPFGRTVVRRPTAGAASTVGNIVWFVLFGLWIAIAHITAGIAQCLTIMGIPLGLANFKLSLVALAPLGKQVVSTSDPHAIGPAS